MDNPIDLMRKAKHFKIIEGEYLIVTSFMDEHIVSFKQFQSIANSLFQGDADFITVNNTILNRKHIYKIEPHKKKDKHYGFKRV
jgi:hypothetical protein